MRLFMLGVLIVAAQACPAADPPGFDAAAAFGARPSVTALALSPDGQSVAWIASTQGPGSALYTMKLTPGAKAHGIMAANGHPEHLASCGWVSNERLVCEVAFLHKDPIFGAMSYGRLLAVNTDGSNMQLLSTPTSTHSRGVAVRDGAVLDWLPEVDDAVLMERGHLPDDHVGSRLGSAEEGLGVDQVDTRNLKSQRIEKPRRDAWQYITDGHGRVRILGIGKANGRDQDTGIIDYEYHPAGSTEYKPLSTYQFVDHEGFWPHAVDPDLNVAYGFKKVDGRLAAYSVSLDGGLKEQLL